MTDFDPLAALERTAAERPDAPALIAPDAELSAAEFLDSARRVALALAEAGVGPGTVVATSLPKLLDAVVVLSLWMLGAVSVGAVGPVLRSELIDLVLVPERDSGLPARRQLLVDDAWLLGTGRFDPAAAPRVERDPDAVRRLIFSSGTTGAPKAIALSARQLGERVRAVERTWVVHHPVLVMLGHATIGGTSVFFSAVSSGAPYLLAGTPEQNLRLIEQTGVRRFGGSPAQLGELLAAARRLPSPPRVELIQSGGAALSEALVGQLIRVFGGEIEIVYGSTEAGTVAVRRGLAQQPGDVGELAEGIEAEILGSEGRAVAEGELGELRVRRPLLPQGYFTGGAPDPGGAFRDGWFHSGDRARIVGRRLVIEGRIDELLNAAGVKIDPVRIDEFAAAQPGVLEAAAFGVTDQRGVAAIALAVVADDGFDRAGLLATLAREFGDAAPRRLHRMAALPRTENGKVRRAELAAREQALIDRQLDLPF